MSPTGVGRDFGGDFLVEPAEHFSASQLDERLDAETRPAPRRSRVQRTCPGTCATRLARISSTLDSTAAVTLAITGRVGARMSSAALSAELRRKFLGGRRSASSGEWNAPETASGDHTCFAPASLSAALAASTAATSPEMTIWPGQLKFAATTMPGVFGADLRRPSPSSSAEHRRHRAGIGSSPLRPSLRRGSRTSAMPVSECRRRSAGVERGVLADGVPGDGQQVRFPRP